MNDEFDFRDIAGKGKSEFFSYMNELNSNVIASDFRSTKQTWNTSSNFNNNQIYERYVKLKKENNQEKEAMNKENHNNPGDDSLIDQITSNNHNNFKEESNTPIRVKPLIRPDSLIKKRNDSPVSNIVDKGKEDAFSPNVSVISSLQIMDKKSQLNVASSNSKVGAMKSMKVLKIENKPSSTAEILPSTAFHPKNWEYYEKVNKLIASKGKQKVVQTHEMNKHKQDSKQPSAFQDQILREFKSNKKTNFDDERNNNTLKKNYKSQNMMGVKANNCGLTDNKINNQDRFASKLSERRKEPNSSLFKKYTDLNINSNYYFPERFDFLDVPRHEELQFKERTNRNYLYNKTEQA